MIKDILESQKQMSVEKVKPYSFIETTEKVEIQADINNEKDDFNIELRV